MIERGEAMAQRIEDYLARRQLWLLACWTVALFAWAIAAAHARPLWFDEIFTWSIARPDASSGIMDQLRRQLDQQPPPFFGITRMAAMFSRNENIAARLPGMFGFWFMTLCVYRFVQRRTGTLAGILAVCLVMNTLELRYAIEARPYGLVAGFSALALVAWQAADSPGQRFWPAAGVAAGVAGAISCSYYGVLVLVPLICGEVARMTRVRVRIWLAMALGTAAAIPWIPLARGSMRTFSGKNWASPHLSKFVDVYNDLIGSLPLVAIAALVVGIYAALRARRRLDPDDGRRTPFSLPEIAAATGFAIMPLAGLAVAMLWTNAYWPRYVLGGAMGIAILLAIAARIATQGSALAAICLIAAASCGVKVNERKLITYTAPRGKALAATIERALTGQPADLPIALDNPLMGLEAMYYSKPALGRRLTFLVDTPAQTKFADVPYPGEMWFTMARSWNFVAAEPVTPFLREHPHFLLLSEPSEFSYLIPLLTERHADIRLGAVSGGVTIYVVTADPATVR